MTAVVKGREEETPEAAIAAAAVAAARSPFSYVGPRSPYHTYTEGTPHAYDYDPHTPLLRKLRDPQLMANFTCNEAVMIQLLDNNYIEYLENSALGTAEQSVMRDRKGGEEGRRGERKR